MRLIRLLTLLAKDVLGGVPSGRADKIIEWEGMYQDVLKKELFVNPVKSYFISSKINILQVGANDGKNNDPIYDFVRENEDMTKVLLVEPVEHIIPYLEENYEYHRNSEVVNKAISLDGNNSISLYGVKKNYWKYVNTEYGKKWSEYRAPTGVVSADEEHVLKWIRENVRHEDEAKKAAEKFKVDSIRPRNLLEKSKIIDNVDVLQVDVEGMDDKVVSSFLEDKIYPKVINIESNHLNRDRNRQHKRRLEKAEYELFDYSARENIALRK